ncbi:MAG: 50S ribosomal protein L29 [Thermodesulfobacteriota bacterium]|nr:50S ribosomal protein L29 [Thermodesulfobacteriota bacterium]
MKVAEYRKLSVDDLSLKVVDLKEEIGKLRFQHSIRPLENTSILCQLKKDVARVMTVLSEKRNN